MEGEKADGCRTTERTPGAGEALVERARRDDVADLDAAAAQPVGRPAGPGVEDRDDHGVQRGLVDVPLVEPVHADGRARVHRRHVRGRGGRELRRERRDVQTPQQRVVRVALDEAHAERVEQHDRDAVDALGRSPAHRQPAGRRRSSSRSTVAGSSAKPSESIRVRFVPQNDLYTRLPPPRLGRSRCRAHIEQGVGSCDASSSCSPRWRARSSRGGGRRGGRTGRGRDRRQLHRRGQAGQRSEGGRRGQEGEGQVRLLATPSTASAAELSDVPGRQAAQRARGSRRSSRTGSSPPTRRRPAPPGAWTASTSAALPLSGTYTYTLDRAGVYAYVIDTGIHTATPQFGGRAASSTTPSAATDRTATATARTWRARSAAPPTASPRASPCAACACSTAGLRLDLGDHRRDELAARPTRPALGGEHVARRRLLVDAQQRGDNLVNSGVFLAVAAGNENQNACNVSPASAASA